MSCDRNRDRLFSLLKTNSNLMVLLGGPDETEEVLGLIYDVASNQPVPEDRAGLLAAAAGFSAMKARAARAKIDLHPHKTGSGLPDLSTQQGWQAVHELLLALEQRRELTPLAEDVLGSVAFRKFCGYSGMWSPAITPTTFRDLRFSWADRPERVAALVRGEMGGEEHAPFLRYLTERLAADPELARDLPLAAAVRHYLTLDEAEMLEPEQRAQWARMLGGAVGMGLGIPVDLITEVCPRCGDEHDGEYQCHPAYRDTLPQIASAVAVALADGDNLGFTPDDNPRDALRRLLDDWEERGIPPDAPAWVHGLLTAQRALDRALIAEMAPNGDALAMMRLDRGVIRDATIRTPLMLDGEPYVWDTGSLYPHASYCRQMAWRDRTLRSWAGNSLLSAEAKAREAVAQISAVNIAALMAGHQLDPKAVAWRPEQLLRRFETTGVVGYELRIGDTVIEPCGCLLSLTGRVGGNSVYQRLGDSPSACSTHPMDSFMAPGGPEYHQRVDQTRPRFSLTWPDPGPGGAGGS